MCKESSKSSTTSVPGYVSDIGNTLADTASNVANKPFESYGGQRVAGFSGDQQSAFQQLRDLIANAPQVGGDAIQGAKDYAAAPGQNIGTERVVDQGGRLGAISDYTDPYMKAADGPLQATLRKIQEASDASRKTISAGATASGAFGDARHGISEAMNEKNRNLAFGDAAGTAYNNAFNAAMAARTGDVNRFKDVDTTNANFAETALGRKLTGTGAELDRATSDQNRMLAQISALLGAGGQQQQNQQAGLDAAYQEFMRKYGDDYQKISGMSQALQGMKGNYDTTTTSTQPDNSLLGLAGSVGGSVLGSNGFWNWMGKSAAPVAMDAAGTALGGASAASSLLPMLAML